MNSGPVVAMVSAGQGGGKPRKRRADSKGPGSVTAAFLDIFQFPCLTDGARWRLVNGATRSLGGKRSQSLGNVLCAPQLDTEQAVPSRGVKVQLGVKVEGTNG